jgi:23S rRNA pseudouridine1911/1915/1917 synthase
VVCRHLSDLRVATRTRVQAWIDAGAVAVNGRPVHRAAARVTVGDRVDVQLPPDVGRRLVMAPEALPLEVLYEDDSLIAVNKPAGMVVHPTYRHTQGTLMNALLWHARSWRHPSRPSIVGRLDKLTSGIVIAAKSTRTHAALQRAMTARHAEKLYLALVYGSVGALRGEIDLPLRRDSRDRRRVVAAETGGAPSLTRFERLGVAAVSRPGLTLLQCQLVTGRMHQIRVHLAARGWPIVGDSKYGAPLWQDLADATLRAELAALGRQALHAWRLSLTHPVTHQRLAIEAPVPTDLDRLLRAAGMAGLVQCRPR